MAVMMMGTMMVMVMEMETVITMIMTLLTIDFCKTYIHRNLLK